MMAQPQQIQRKFSSHSYYELKDLFAKNTQNYLEFLEEVHKELEYRSVPWPVELRKEIRKQIDSVSEGMKKALSHLP
jgi:5-methylcytosine-specific restriction endonuclease McrBC GTP-binding regulatory subunit McrB